MATFKVQTSGPGFTVSKPNLYEAVEWAKSYMPLKRGWTFKVNYGKDNSAAIHRYNSKGRKLEGYSALVRLVSNASTPTTTRKSRVRVSPPATTNLRKLGY